MFSSANSFFDGWILIHLKLLLVAASWGLAWVAGREIATSLPEAIAAWYRYAITVPLLFICLYAKERKDRGKIVPLFVPQGEMFLNITSYFSQGQPLYMLLYASGIIFFTFFYTSIVFNPTETAENLRKYGGFIPGIRPGESTAIYILSLIHI